MLTVQPDTRSENVKFHEASDGKISDKSSLMILKAHSVAPLPVVSGHVDKWRSQSLMQAMSMKPRKLSAVLS